MAADTPDHGMYADFLKDLEAVLKRASIEIKDIKPEAYRQASDLFDRHEEMIHDFGASSDTFRNMYAGVTEIQENFYGMSAENGDALSVIFKNQADLIREYQGIVDSNLLQIHATSEAVTAKEMADLTLLGRALSYNTDQSQDFLERQFSLTGEVNNELLKQSLAYSKAIEDSTGISSKIIAGNISGMMSDVKTFGNMTVEEMSEAAAAIAKVGLEVTDVAGLVGKFSTFEGAADSVSKLTQVFGVQMDTMKYMTASFESPEEMLAMIQEDFETAGVDMANMSIIQKRILADATGMDVEAIERLHGAAGSGLSQFTSQISEATAGVGSSEINGALANASEDIKQLNQMGDSVSDALLKAAERTKKGIASIFSEGIRALADEASSFAGQSIRLVNIGSNEAKDEISNIFSIKDLQDDLTVVLKGGTDAMREFADELMDGKASIESYTNSLVDLIVKMESKTTIPSEGGQSSPATPIVLTDDQAGLINAAAYNDPALKREGITVIQIDENDSQDKLKTLVKEVNEASGNKFSIEQMEQMFISLLAQQKELNKDNEENQTINITITDTGPGFEWKADRAGLTIVSN